MAELHEKAPGLVLTLKAARWLGYPIRLFEGGQLIMEPLGPEGPQDPTAAVMACRPPDRAPITGGSPRQALRGCEKAGFCPAHEKGGKRG